MTAVKLFIIALRAMHTKKDFKFKHSKIFVKKFRLNIGNSNLLT